MKVLGLVLICGFTLVCPAVQDKETITVPPEIIESYVGFYELSPDVHFKITSRNGVLFSQLTGQPDFPIFPESHTRFAYGVVEAALVFHKGDDGKVSHLVLYQNGMQQKAHRLEKEPEKETSQFLDKKDAALIAGTWAGMLETLGLRVEVVLEVDDQGKLSGNVISLDQGNAFMPMDWVRFEEGKLRFSITTLQVSYEGKLEGDTIEGIFKQAGAMELVLTRNKRPKQVTRPQIPKRPYPYHEEEVAYTVPQGGHTIAGTLTLPPQPGPFPAVILIGGSGPQDRDESLLGHKPFLVLSDHLTRKGIAVLRVDDRGIAKSTGNFSTATTRDFADDVEAGVAWLKNHSRTTIVSAWWDTAKGAL